MCDRPIKPSSLWIIRVALAVQFAGVLAVPVLVADLAQESPKQPMGIIERAVQSLATNNH